MNESDLLKLKSTLKRYLEATDTMLELVRTQPHLAGIVTMPGIQLVAPAASAPTTTTASEKIRRVIAESPGKFSIQTIFDHPLLEGKVKKETISTFLWNAKKRGEIAVVEEGGGPNPPFYQRKT